MAGDGMDPTLAAFIVSNAATEEKNSRQADAASAQSLPINSGSTKPHAPPKMRANRARLRAVRLYLE